MTTISVAELRSRFAESIAVAGWTWDLQESGKPLVGVLTSPSGEPRTLRVFIQNVSHGGGDARPAEEFRIQISNVPPLDQDPAGSHRVLLGWSEDHGVFAAFDPTRHIKPGDSPSSVQIAQDTLERAQALGLATQIKGADEVAMALAPDHLATYLFAAAAVHEDTIAPHPQDADVWADVEVAANPQHATAQGFQNNQAAKVATELHAMAEATAHLSNLGWTVTDVSATAPYDLHCTRDGGELRVEVKGTAGLGAKVIVTANEVTHAMAHQPNVALIVVSGIVIEADPPVASGGDLNYIGHWTPTDEDLQPISYYCKVPPAIA